MSPSPTSASASASAAPSTSRAPEHRFTLSDYYTPEELDARRANSTSAKGRAKPSQSQATGPSASVFASTSATSPKAGQSGSSRKPTLPTIITTNPPPSLSRATTIENSLELDLFDQGSTSSRRPSLTPSQSPDPLGVMSHPLGPGPQPYPASPDGHTSDTEEYTPEPTYPPRGYYGNSPSAPSRSHAARGPQSTARDLQRELGMADPAHGPGGPGGPGPSSATASNAYAELSPRSEHSSAPARSLHGMTSPPSAHFDPHIAHLSQARADRNQPHGSGRSTVSPSYDDEKRSGSEKDLVRGPTTSREVGGQTVKHARIHSTKFLKGWLPKSWPCRLLLITVFLEAIINIAIQANLLWRFQLQMDETGDYQTNRRMPVYLYIFVSAHIVQCGLTIWAIKTRNTIQVVGLALFNCLFLIYCGIEIEEVRNTLDSSIVIVGDGEKHSLLTLPIKVLTTVSICVVAASVGAVVTLTWFIWREFGWDIYRSLGADLRIRKYYFQYQVFETIVCFAFFFFAGFGIQFAVLVLQHDDPEYIVTWVMFPLLILWLVMGLVSARFEWAPSMAAFLIGLVCGTAYFIFKLVRIWTKPGEYRTVQKSLTVFSVLSLLMIILTIVYGAMIWHNFDKGLRTTLDTRRKERKAEQHAMSQTGPGMTQPSYSVHRLTID